jgi:hypothetical protein
MDPLGIVSSLQYLLLIAFAQIFYRAARIDDAPPLLWAGLSVIVYLLTWGVLSWGILGCIVGQALLFLAFAIVRTITKKRVW